MYILTFPVLCLCTYLYCFVVILLFCVILCFVSFCCFVLFCILCYFVVLCHFVVLCYFVFCVILLFCVIFIFVCTSAGLLPPGESPIAVSSSSSSSSSSYSNNTIQMWLKSEKNSTLLKEFKLSFTVDGDTKLIFFTALCNAIIKKERHRCVNMATMFNKTPHNVTLYIHCMCCYTLFRRTRGVEELNATKHREREREREAAVTFHLLVTR